MVCACAHDLKIGPQPRRGALWQILLWHIWRGLRNGHCARRRVSEANRGNAPVLRPEIDRSLPNILQRGMML